MESIKIPVEMDLSKVVSEIERVKKELKEAVDGEVTGKLEEELKGLNKQFHELSVAAGEFRLDEKFDAIYGEVQPLTTQLGELEDRMYALALAGKKDTEEFEALRVRAAEFRATIIDVDKSVDLFGENTGFMRVNTALGEVGDSLLSLDFIGAAKRAQGLQQAVNAITVEEVQRQMKGLQDTFAVLGKVSGQAIGGLMKNIGGIAKAFLNFGKMLLTNPIFLIATAIVLIVTAIGALLNKLGILKPIMEAIGKVFEWIGWVIDKIVEGFNMLTDWLGLTNIAAENAAIAHTKAAEKKADAYEKEGKRIITQLDTEIKIAQINGQRTVEMEIKKQRVIIHTAALRAQALQAKIREAKITGDLEEEELKDLQDKLDAQRELYKAAATEIRIIREQDKVDRKKKAADEAKNDQDQAKQAAQNAKQYEQNRLKARRELRDLELSLMAEGLEKELALSSEHYKRAIEDVRRNEQLVAEEKTRQIELLQQADKKAQGLIEAAAEKKRKEDEAAEIAAIEASTAEMTRVMAERQNRVAVATAEIKAKDNEDDLQAQKDLLEAKMNQELANESLMEEEKSLIRARYREEEQKLEKDARDKELEEERQANESRKEIYENYSTAVQQLSELVFSIRLGFFSKGAKEEERIARQQFKVNKALQLSTAIISGIQAVQSVLAAPSILPEPLGSALKVARAIQAGATSAANIAKIAATKFESTSGSGEGGSASSSTQSTGGAMTPATMNMFGTAGKFNSTQQGKQVEEGPKEIIVKAVVPPDDITAAFELKAKAGKNSTL